MEQIRSQNIEDSRRKDERPNDIKARVWEELMYYRKIRHAMKELIRLISKSKSIAEETAQRHLHVFIIGIMPS